MAKRHYTKRNPMERLTRLKDHHIKAYHRLVKARLALDKLALKIQKAEERFLKANAN